MPIGLHQLLHRLHQGLVPIYLLSGDEPLQLGEGAQWVRQRAREAGYTEREVMEQGADFDWGQLATAAGSLSLFAERRLIELRLSTSKIGSDGSQAICALCQDLAPDTLFLILSPRLDRSQLGSAWVSAIDRAGLVVQVWPVEGAALIPWLEQRMRAVGLQPDRGAAELLAERVEGNLLAAAQEVEKLALLHGEGPISLEQVARQSVDSARFDVFDLTDAALAGAIDRVPRILEGLRGEGTAAAVVLWALARELRTLAQMAQDPRRGIAPPSGAYLSEKRRAAYRSALQRHPRPRILAFLGRCAHIDLEIKGQAAGDEWDALLRLVTELAGAVPIASPAQP